MDPYHIAKVIANPVPEQETDPETGKLNYGYINAARDAEIFDMGQGTGVLGKLLTADGFTNIEGGDASESFVETANASGWYTSCSVLWFGKGIENLPPSMLSKYDIVMATGVFVDGHIPASGFDDAHAMCKPDGYFVTCIRKSYYEVGEEHGYREKLDELEAAGKI